MDFDHSRRDLINELPRDIIEAILTKLPIRDAVRTCILSRSWRYKWTLMTRILFDDGRLTSCRDIVGFINGLLEVDRRIPYFRRRDAKKLTLKLGNFCQNDFRVPPCIFSCKNLTRLELRYKCVAELPPRFAGFSCVKRLVLKHVSIPLKDIERLISSCPLLESLTLAFIVRSELTIRAPNLKRLNVQGMGICLGNTPLLVNVTVSLFGSNSNFEDSSTYNCLEKLLGDIPKIERLHGNYNFTRSLSAGYGRCRFITYEFLKRIQLSEVNVENSKEVLVALHLIFSSPNLQELHIKCCRSLDKIEVPFLNFFKDPFLANRTMDRLEQVKIYGSPDESAIVKLIEFLLDRSPSLVMMIIRPSSFGFVDEERRQLLSSFRRASHKASVVISDGKLRYEI